MSIVIQDLFFQYAERPLFNNLSSIIPEGGLCLIQGPSGCGKSTLLKLIAGLIKPLSGQITIGNNSEKKSVGYLHQDLNLIEHWSIKENLSLADCQVTIQDKWLRNFNLSMNSNTLVSALSGGEKQRIGLIRTMLLKANIILLDEPTAHLDDLHTDIVLNSLKEVFVHQTVLIVSHDQRVQKYADHTINWQKEIIHAD
ncbi:MAG: ATP-binding cassette domain-containing protein [Bdellovibrionaceae bacterium]|nr:ATP-binding cassette domain-containing protein [Bdellovibrio sp.]